MLASVKWILIIKIENPVNLEICDFNTNNSWITMEGPFHSIIKVFIGASWRGPMSLVKHLFSTDIQSQNGKHKIVIRGKICLSIFHYLISVKDCFTVLAIDKKSNL